jgi:hypothetical protein
MDCYHIATKARSQLTILGHCVCTLRQKKLKLSHYTPWKRLGERRCSSYSFLTWALDGGEWSAARPGRALAQGKGLPVPIVQEAGWAPEPVWTQVRGKILCRCRGSNPDRPVRSQTLYWLRYPGSHAQTVPLWIALNYVLAPIYTSQPIS